MVTGASESYNFSQVLKNKSEQVIGMKQLRFSLVCKSRKCQFFGAGRVWGEATTLASGAKLLANVVAVHSANGPVG